MKHHQDLLKEACTQLAMEEAEQILHDLDEETMEQADQLFRRHRKTRNRLQPLSFSAL